MSSFGGVGAAFVIAANNIRRVLRQPVMLFTTLALPFIVILVVGSALAGSRNTLQLGVVSHDHAAVSTALVSNLRHLSGLSVRSYGSDTSLELAVRRGQVDAGAVIPAGYGAALSVGDATTVRFVTTPDQRRSASIRALLTGALERQTTTLQAAAFSHRLTGRPIAAETARAAKLLAGVPGPLLAHVTDGTPSSQRLGFEYTAPSNLVLFVIITSLTSAGALIDSRTRGITTRMFALPISRRTVLLGELLGRFLTAIAQATVILLFSTVAFGVSWGNPVAVLAITLAICVFGAALGMLVGFTARSMSQAVAFGPPFGIVLGMLGGCMWPLSIVPAPVRAFGHVTPNAWAMDAYVKAIDDHVGIGAVIGAVGVIAAFAVGVFMLAGLVVRRTIAT